MIGEAELCAMFKVLDTDTLREWLAAGLVRGAGAGPVRFDEADVARVRLICELRYDLDVEETSLPLVLSLVDQLYDLRRSMRAIAVAVSEQPGEVRVQISARARRHLRPAE
jgi:chaperone modulatory protein CbpM